LSQLAGSINPMVMTVRAAVARRGHPADLPLVLRCPDLPLFVTNWLDIPWPEGARVAESMIEVFAGQIIPPVRLLGLGPHPEDRVSAGGR